MEYIQTSGSRAEGFVIEYQTGSLEQHFQSTRFDIPLSTVESIFQSYLEGDSSWESMAEWNRDDLSQATTEGFPILYLSLGVAVALVGLFVWWKSA
jgi:hypothetical protein